MLKSIHFPRNYMNMHRHTDAVLQPAILLTAATTRSPLPPSVLQSRCYHEVHVSKMHVYLICMSEFAIGVSDSTCTCIYPLCQRVDNCPIIIIRFVHIISTIDAKLLRACSCTCNSIFQCYVGIFTWCGQICTSLIDNSSFTRQYTKLTNTYVCMHVI